MQESRGSSSPAATGAPVRGGDVGRSYSDSSAMAVAFWDDGNVEGLGKTHGEWVSQGLADPAVWASHDRPRFGHVSTGGVRWSREGTRWLASQDCPQGSWGGRGAGENALAVSEGREKKHRSSQIGLIEKSNDTRWSEVVVGL